MKQEFSFEVRKDGEKITIGYRYGIREWLILAVVLGVWGFMLVEVLPNIIQH